MMESRCGLKWIAILLVTTASTGIVEVGLHSSFSKVSNITGGPSITFSFGLHEVPNLDVPLKSKNVSKNAAEYYPMEESEYVSSVHSVTGDESLSQSYVKTEVPLYDLGTLPLNDTTHVRQRRELQTECINPTISKVDECIETMDRKVVEKCFPGLNKALQGEEEPIFPGPYMHQSKNVEVCLRQAFGSCSYDARYKIMTKLKVRSGINLNIPYQDEYVMDCCSEDTIMGAIENVRVCLKALNKTMSPQSTKDTTSSCLECASTCVEDHTTFTCALQNKTLFNHFVRELLSLLRESSLSCLNRQGSKTQPSKDFNAMRLCLNWIDYSRLDFCEPDFYQYVLRLQNGTRDEALFTRVRKCFRDSLSVCGHATVDLLIRVLAGSLEGKGGVEPDGLPDAPHPKEHGMVSRTYKIKVGAPNMCTNEQLQQLVQSISKCFRQKLQNNVSQDANKVMQNLFKCFCPENVQKCDIHKYSQLEMVITQLTKELLDSAGSSLSRPDQRCTEDLKKESYKYCLPKLFLYHIALTHAHHSPESLQMQLNKVKICLEIKLQHCPSDVVKHLLEFYAVILKIPNPKLTRSQQDVGILTKVTIPEGFIWCETRIFTIDQHVSTQEFHFPPETETYTQVMTTSTISRRIMPPKRVQQYHVNPRPPVVPCVYTEAPKIYTMIIRPTTSIYHSIPVRVVTQVFYIPPPIPRTKIYQPVFTPRIEYKRPTTVQFYTMKPKPRVEDKQIQPVNPRVRIYPGHTKIVVLKIAPTTSIPHHAHPTIQHFSHRVPWTTETSFVMPTKTIRTQILPQTTVVPKRVQVPERRFRKTVRPFSVICFEITPKPVEYPQHVTPTTVRTFDYPIRPIQTQQFIPPTTARQIHVQPPETRFTQHYPLQTRKVEFPPKVFEYTQKQHPTTVIVKRFTHGVLWFTNIKRIRRPGQIFVRKDNCFSGNGQTYLGTVSVSLSGKKCLSWCTEGLDVKPGPQHPELNGCHNYCRNPGGLLSQPWCYTSPDSTCKELCKVPICSEDCFVGKGENYQGQISVTVSGLPCLPWSLFPLSEQYPDLCTGHNYCRNPDGSKPAPWCFVHSIPPKAQECIVKPCESENKPKTRVETILILPEPNKPPVHTIPPVPPVVKIIKPPVREVAHTLQPTTTHTIRYTPPVVTQVETQTPTTQRIILDIPEIKTVTQEQPPIQPEVVTHKPREWRIVKQYQPPVVHEIRQVRIKHIEFGVHRPPVTPKVLVFTHPTQPPQIITQNPVKPDIVTVPEQKVGKVVLCVVPFTRIIRPPYRPTTFMEIQPTPVYTKAYPVQPVILERREYETTIHHIVDYPEVKVQEMTVKQPTTRTIIYGRTNIWYDVRFPTTFRDCRVTPPSAKIKKKGPPYTTRIEHYVLAECYYDNGEGYTGKVSTTISGHKCKPWKDQEICNKVDRNVELCIGHNFCRNPGGVESQPWCYKEGSVKAMCGLVSCEAIHKYPTTIKGIYQPLIPTQVVREIPPQPPVYIVFTPAPGIDERYHITETETSIIRWTIPGWSHEEVYRPTTQKCIEEQPPKRVITVTYPPATTRFIIYTPPPHYVTYWRTYTTKRQIMQLTCKTILFQRHPITPRYIDYHIKTRRYTQSITPTTVQRFEWKVIRKIIVATVRAPKIEHFTIPPFHPPFVEAQDVTTISYFSVRIEGHEEVITMQPTTVQSIIEEVPCYTETQHIPPPVPKYFEHRPIEAPYKEHRIPTTFSRMHITMPPQKPQRRKIPPFIPPPKFFLPERQTIHQWIKPTTFFEYNVFPTAGFDLVTRPPVYPRRLDYNPPPPTERHQERTPTTTEFFIYPPRPWTVTQHRPNPTYKIVVVRNEVQPMINVVPPHQPSKRKFPPRPKEYNCAYPKKRTSEQCTVVRRKRPPKPCAPDVMKGWTSKIRVCVEGKLKEQGMNLMMFVNHNGKGADSTILNEQVACCISEVGELHCRTEAFNLLDSIKEVVVHEVQPKGRGRGAELPYRLAQELQACVTQMDISAAEQCHPGLYKVINDIAVYGKIKVSMQLPPSGDLQCGSQVLGHCSAAAKEKIESEVWHVFEICLCSGGEKSSCKVSGSGGGHRSRRTICLDSSQFLACANGAMQKHSQSGAMSIFAVLEEKCATIEVPKICPAPSWNEISPVIEHIFQGVAQASSDECSQVLVKSKPLNHCLRSLVEIGQYMREINASDIIKIMEPLYNCIQTNIRPCKPELGMLMISMILSLMHIPYHEFPDLNSNSYEMASSVITSIRAQPEKLQVCQHPFSGREGPMQIFQDECAPLSQASDSPYVLMKSCRDKQVEEYLIKLRNCVDNKAAEKGLTNPEFLTLARVQMFIIQCSDQQGPIICRPRDPHDFKKFMKGILMLLKQNTLSASNSACKNSLDIKSFERCLPMFQHYLVSSNGYSGNKGSTKAKQCLQGAFKACKDQKFIGSLVELFGKTTVLDEKAGKLIPKGELQSCTKGAGPSNKEPFLEFEPGSRTPCGAGGVLVDREKRALKRIRRFSNDISLEAPPAYGVDSVTELRRCESMDFLAYFEKIQSCRGKKINSKFRKNKDRCIFSSCKVSWVAMLECLLENQQVLQCNVNTNDQIDELLKHASHALNACNNGSSSCPPSNWCYDSDFPNLNLCSAAFYKLLNKENSLDSVLTVSKEIVSCLSLVWTDCPENVPIMTLPYVFTPLGITLPFMDGSKFRSCTLESSENVSESIQCLPASSISHNALQQCENCIASKEQLCLFSSLSEMHEMTSRDIDKLAWCLNHSDFAGNCISDILLRAKNSCLPLYYFCTNNVRDGHVPRIIDFCWKFFKCLQMFPKSCPEESHSLLLRVLYKTVGLDLLTKTRPMKLLPGT